MVKKAFLLISLLFLATYTASAEKASKYTISIDGGSTTEYSYTDWPALMTQVKTYTGTAAARVTVTITGNDFDANDNMPTVQNVNTILCAGDDVAYTTFKFVDCTFQKGDQYDCISFGYATVKGVVLEFHGCTLEERLYGNEAGTAEGTHYNIDVKFYGCTFASASTGGRYFGDLLFDGCEFTNLVSWENTEAIVNAQNATDGVFCRRQNSVGAESTFTMKNCTFDQPITDATWFRFIYAPDFENYDIDLGHYFYPCLSDTYVIEDLAKYNADKLGTGKVKTLKIENNDSSSSNNVLLAFLPARVKYDANAPESATVSGETKDDNLYEPGQDFTVKTNGFSCAGYAFTGWNTLANPTELNPGTAYTEGQVAQVPLTIGFKLYAQWAELSGLTITASGLLEGESAVFTVNSSTGDVDTPLLQVMIKGEAGGGGSRTVRGLAAGNYKVVPASWSWTYDIDEESIDVTLDGTNPAEAEFTLTKKDSTLPENVEKVKVNNF